MDRQYFVYILTNRRNGALYTGVTHDLAGRVYTHKQKILEGFTQKYDVRYLVYFEAHASPEAAIRREKQIKKWKREWKIELVDKFNPAWRDLYDEIVQ